MADIAEIDNNAPVAKPAASRRAARGRTHLANLINEDDDTSDNGSNGPVAKKSTGGIYSLKLDQTKQEIKDNHHKFDTVVETEILNNKQSKIHSNDNDEDDKRIKDLQAIVKHAEEDNENDEIVIPDSVDSDSPPSPPPQPNTNVTRTRRRSDQQVDRQLKELEALATRKPKNKTKKNDESFNCSIVLDIDDDEIFNIITVKVLTKDGICSFEMNKNQNFTKMYEDLAVKHSTQADGIVLMLKDKVINYHDTPASINLKIYDIIDCGKVTSKAKQERIKIINDEEDETNENVPPNLIRIIFQTEEGRKSRVKFLIMKTETFENVLNKYKEKRGMSDGNYLIEFDGERVDLKSTPTDLDLDGDEIMDVKKGSKTVLQKVAENQKVYDYDDDILPC